MEIHDVTFRAKGYKYPVRLIYENALIRLRFSFNRDLINVVKTLDTARWSPDDKSWTIKNNSRNAFRLSYLMGNNPFARYDGKIPEVDVIKKMWPTTRPLKDHQYQMWWHCTQRRHCILAADMGTGKTLTAIETVEWFQANVHGLERGDVWYFAPVSGVRSTRRELIKWDHSVPWVLETYNMLPRIMRDWRTGKRAPRIVIFDESSKVKNPTAQRSQAAFHLSEAMRHEYGEDSLCVLMSGTPAPRVPTDWWHQCEIARPGFLIESTIRKLEERLAVVEMRDSLSGGVYPHRVCWRDQEGGKCNICGEEEHLHIGKDHKYQPIVNEIHNLYKRLSGLALVVFKKDVTDLPEKVYDIIAIKPTVDMLQTATTLRKTAPRALTAMAWLRELSDGFLYKMVKSDRDIDCPVCYGTGKEMLPVDLENEDDPVHSLVAPIDEDLGIASPGVNIAQNPVDLAQVVCSYCKGTGKTKAVERQVQSIGSPKDKVLLDLLDEYEDNGRVIIWGGFQATIDRICELVRKEGWTVLRVDGRGYKGLSPEGDMVDSEILLDAMDLSNKNHDKLKTVYPKVAFVGHPQAGGMALTLTASPVAIYYSNSFDGEARPQSEDRGHRLGMDINKGFRIIDIMCLPTDFGILQNLKLKRKLQAMTMGDLNELWSSSEADIQRYQEAQ